MVNANDDDPVLSFDLLELVFTRNLSGDEDLWVARRDSPDDPWDPPARIDELATADGENGAVLSSDALTIWFSSTRPGGFGNTDIWTATRADRDSPWSTPTHVPELSGTGFELGSAVYRNDLRYVQNNSPTLDVPRILHEATRSSVASAWGPLVPIDELTSPEGERNATVSPDGRVIYFVSERGATSDIYVATRADPDGPWSAPAPVSEINTGDTEDDPTVSADLHHIVFSRLTPDGWRVFTASR
jgi:hypothetical protein